MDIVAMLTPMHQWFVLMKLCSSNFGIMGQALHAGVQVQLPQPSAAVAVLLVSAANLDDVPASGPSKHYLAGVMA